MRPSIFRADLHCHSSCSDGSYTPAELVQMAQDRGLQALSITDHDTIDAYSLLPNDRDKALIVVAGVEFTADFAGSTVHVLGYAMHLLNERLLWFCEEHKARRIRRAKAMLHLLRKQGIQLSWEELLTKSPSVGRLHIAQLIVSEGYAKSLKEVFSLYLGDEKRCFVPSDSFSIQETIEVIHQAGGFAVLAHPHLMKKASLVKKILPLGFDGIEGYYAKLPHSQESRWVTMGHKNGLIVTGGSDFHGAGKPYISLGCSWAPEDSFRVIHERHIRNNG